MRQVEKHVVKEEHDWFDYCNDITTLSRLLYNTAQFTQRQGYFYGWGTQTQASLDTLFKQNENYKAMPAKVAQLVLKQNADAWIAYYKAFKLERVGITVKVAEESYTSKASAIDWDIIPTYDPNNKVRHLFSGRRVKRAWYVSKNGFKIHADVNAGYNIGRKSNPEGFDSLKFILRDKGCLVVHPRRITPLFRRVHAESRVA
ncbi:MAG: zinc ribbon domain-containing protein [Nostoc sp.]